MWTLYKSPKVGWRRGVYLQFFCKFLQEEWHQERAHNQLYTTVDGVAKKKNMTIVEMARSMMKEKGLLTNYWGQVAAIVVYLINRCPTKAVCDKIPLEAWS